jgi:hypothetical protein
MDLTAFCETTSSPAIQRPAGIDLDQIPELDNPDGWQAFFLARQPVEDATSSALGVTFASALLDFMVGETSSDPRLSFDYMKGRLWLERRLEPETPSEMLSELRSLLGFSWSEVADLLSVDRRSIHSWNMQSLLRKKNRERLSNTLSAIRFADRGDSELNRLLLESKVPNGPTLAALLTNGQHELFRMYAGEGFGRPIGTPISKEWLQDHGRRSLELQQVDIPDNIVPVNRSPAKGKVRRTVRRA